MKGKKGWERIPIIERLYKISGRSWYAKKIFDNYFEAVCFLINIDVPIT